MTTTMVDPNASKFIASLVKSLQMMCHGCMDFSNNIEIMGYMSVRIDNGQKLDYIVNEQVSKHGQESTFFQSNSYHSLPPIKDGHSEPEGMHGAGWEGFGLNHRLGSPLTALGGTCLQVDLSGPVPVTRSTFTSSPDGFFGNKPSHPSSKDHQVLEKETREDVLATANTPSHDSSQHSVGPPRVCENIDGWEVNTVDDEDGGSDFTADVPTADDELVNGGAGHCQDIVIKLEPKDDIFSSVKGESEEACAASAKLSALTLPSHLAAASASFSDQSAPHVTTEDPSGFTEHDSCTSQEDSTIAFKKHSPRSSVSMCLPEGFVGRDNSQNLNGVRCLAYPEKSRPPENHGVESYVNVADESAHGVFTAGTHREKNSEWWCRLCSKFFRQGNLLSLHMQLVHPNVDSSESVVGNGRGQSDSVSASGLMSISSASVQGTSMSVSDQTFQGFCRNSGPEFSRNSADCAYSMSFPKPGHAASGSSKSSVKSVSSVGLQNCTFQALQMSTGLDTPQLNDNFFTYPSQSFKRQSIFFDNQNNGTFLHPVNFTEADIPSTAATSMAHMSPLKKQRYSGRRCQHCHKILLLSTAQFVEHEQKCIKERRGLECQQCGRSFASRVALNDHMDSMHTKKGFQCHACGMVFKWRTYVYQHRYKCAAYKIKKEAG